GPATVILAGFTIGLESAVYTALLIGAAVFGAYLLGGGSVILGLFCVALAGTGLLTTVGVIVAMDTFGPFSDSVKTAVVDTGAQLDDNVRNLQYTGVLNVSDPKNLVGLIIGASVVFM